MTNWLYFAELLRFMGSVLCKVLSFRGFCYHLVYNLLLFNSFLRHVFILEVGNSCGFFFSQIKAKCCLYPKNMGAKTTNEKTGKYLAAQQASCTLKYYIISYIYAYMGMFFPARVLQILYGYKYFITSPWQGRG